MSAENWKLERDKDARGHERFAIVRESSAFAKPLRVALLSGWVSREMAEKFMDVLIDDLEEKLTANENWRKSEDATKRRVY